MTTSILICCPDEEYISELECAFVRTLKATVQLDFITNEEYYLRFMQESNPVDVLILDEQWVDLNPVYAARRTIYITERDVLSPDTINKLDGPSAIIKCLDPSLLAQPDESDTPSTKILDVFSSLGGCGKTVAALGIAQALSTARHNVLYINADYLQSFHEILSPDSCNYLSSEAILLLSGDASVAADRLSSLIGNCGFDYLLPLDKAIPLYQFDDGLFYDFCSAVASRNTYDYIVLEHPTILSRKSLSRLGQASQLFYVTRQDSFSVLRFQHMLRSLGSVEEKCMLVYGWYREDCVDAFDTEGFLEKYPVCARIPATDRAIILEDLRNADYFTSAVTLL